MGGSRTAAGDREVEEWRQRALDEAETLAELGVEEDDDCLPAKLRAFESGPIVRSVQGPRVPLARHRLVLCSGAAPEVAVVLYRCGQMDLEPVLLASILKRWREAAGAELAECTADTLTLILPQPLEDDAGVRRSALEIYAVNPALEDARHILGMAASRRWSFRWD